MSIALCTRAQHQEPEYVEEDGLHPMTLVVSLQHERQLVLAADGMGYYSAVGGSYAYPTHKLYPVADTGWIFAFAGSGEVKVLHGRLETELKRGDFKVDPSIEIGGVDYLNRLGRLYEAKDKSVALIAGFDSNSQPKVLSKDLPGSISEWGGIGAIGAQRATALWMMNTMAPCCSSLEEVKHLACFTIWQVSRKELTVGSPERGYVVSLCVLDADRSPQWEELGESAVSAWMHAWLQKLQDAFKQSLKKTLPPTVHG